ncbi:MAG: 1-acyl-sn-glycerol-3-phosphate acyltransferase [Porticoccaceae bacterium]|nr:1-acyl-sn-glycerol-3-phosphate acyltransferase [Porticoccaceae bacterium]
MIGNQIFPIVPAHHQGRRIALSRKLAGLFLRSMGWRVTGAIPEDQRFIFVTGPHTSNWDFVFGLSAAVAMNIDAHWLGKNTLFKQPLKDIMYWLGGIPIDRSNPAGVAEDIAGKIRQAGDMALIITPEGTRGKVERLKSGFLRIAKMSDSKLLITTLDYANKTLHLGEVLTPGENMAANIDYIADQFAQVTPKNPHNV